MERLAEQTPQPADGGPLVNNEASLAPHVGPEDLWILIQFVNGIGSIANTPETGGVAYLAHIGGFAAGVVLISLFAAGRRRLAHA